MKVVLDGDSPPTCPCRVTSNVITTNNPYQLVLQSAMTRMYKDSTLLTKWTFCLISMTSCLNQLQDSQDPNLQCMVVKD